MKLRFVVLACAKNSNRQDMIINTWGKDENILFLSDTPHTPHNPNVSTISYVSPEYNDIGRRYRNFFKDQNNLDKSCDWYIMCDDDTFIFLPRLKRLLEQHNTNDPLAIGWAFTFDPGVQDRRVFGQVEAFPVPFLSGGAGICLTKNSVERIFGYVNSTPEPAYNKYSDTSLGFWMRRSGVKLIGNKSFCPSCPGHCHEKAYPVLPPTETITYHGVQVEKFIEYQKYNNER